MDIILNSNDDISTDRNHKMKKMKTWQEIHKPIFETSWFQTLRSFVKEERKTKSILPSGKEVLNAFKLTPFEDVKVVIIGQDPYPDRNHAHGLAFSSLANKTPASLENIFKEIQRSLFPGSEGQSYKLLFKHNNLSSWARQGILLINTVLTVEEGNIGSHKGRGWEKFTEEIIKELNDHDKALVFLLWGKHAQQYQHFITDPKHLVGLTSHPSPLSVDQGFNGCNHFKAIQSFIRDDYFDLRPFINYNNEEGFIENIKKFAIKNNIIFDEKIISTMPLGVFVPDVKNKTQINYLLDEANAE